MGDMGELGTDAAASHRKVGRQAYEAGVETLLTLGELSECAVMEFGSGGQHFTDLEELLAKAKNCLDESTVVLIKGSRFMRMERVVERLQT